MSWFSLARLEQPQAENLGDIEHEVGRTLGIRLNRLTDRALAQAENAARGGRVHVDHPWLLEEKGRGPEDVTGIENSEQ